MSNADSTKICHIGAGVYAQPWYTTLCGEPANGDSACCAHGDFCMENSICHFTHTQANTSGYYVAGCTDASHSSPACSSRCCKFSFPPPKKSQIDLASPPRRGIDQNGAYENVGSRCPGFESLPRYIRHRVRAGHQPLGLLLRCRMREPHGRDIPGARARGSQDPVDDECEFERELDGLIEHCVNDWCLGASGHRDAECKLEHNERHPGEHISAERPSRVGPQRGSQSWHRGRSGHRRARTDSAS
ncbi:MAG: hypothetical protein LQ352_005785, partial [Teloschistes flavicans]